MEGRRRTDGRAGLHQTVISGLKVKPANKPAECKHAGIHGVKPHKFERLTTTEQQFHRGTDQLDAARVDTPVSIGPWFRDETAPVK
jgi:hypothetical protein